MGNEDVPDKDDNIGMGEDEDGGDGDSSWQFSSSSNTRSQEKREVGDVNPNRELGDVSKEWQKNIQILEEEIQTLDDSAMPEEVADAEKETFGFANDGTDQAMADADQEQQEELVEKEEEQDVEMEQQGNQTMWLFR